jgi:hypothetical protein
MIYPKNIFRYIGNSITDGFAAAGAVTRPNHYPCLHLANVLLAMQLGTCDIITECSIFRFYLGSRFLANHVFLPFHHFSVWM